MSYSNLCGKRGGVNFFWIKKEYKTILSVGGSLGSRNKNKALEEQIDKIKNKKIQLIWQTGSIDFERLKSNEKLKADNIKIIKFIHDMRMAYAAADIIVSRAGAIAISELCLVGKPVVLMPLPWAAEDHQTKNAEVLVRKNAALMIKDSEANEKLVPVVLALLKDEKKQKRNE